MLYCRFFELDTNKDSKLSKEDLLRYNDCALSEVIVDRYNIQSSLFFFFVINRRIQLEYLRLGFEYLATGWREVLMKTEE